MALLNFDASTVEAPSFETIPAGVYEAVIVESKLQETKSGNGEMLVLTLEIISGDYAGRKLWDYLNVNHSNPMAVKIARQTLAGICIATGRDTIDDTQELHDIPMYIKVKTRQLPDGDFSNEIKSYHSKSSFQTPTKSPSSNTQEAKPSAPTTPVKSTSNPWIR